MSQDVLAVAQLVSILVGAFGAPGLTFWVMKKMSRETLHHIRDNCQACKERLHEKLDALDHALEEAVKRQMHLRERLPIEYVRREEYNRHLNGCIREKSL